MTHVRTPGASLARLVLQHGCLALGVGCPGCGAPSARICQACRDSLRTGLTAPVERWVLGGRQPLPVWSATSYTDRVPALVRAWKDHQAWSLTPPFAAVLAQLIDHICTATDPVILVPVGSSRAAVRRRHLDQTVQLARALARARPGPTRVKVVLRRARAVGDQRSLGAGQRWENQRGTMRLRRGATAPGPGVLILVDDVVTTGSTLAEAARCLDSAGWPLVGAVTVAATPRRHR